MSVVQSIVDYVRQNPDQTATQIAHGINHKPGNVSSALKRLTDKQTLKRVSTGKTGNLPPWTYSFNHEPVQQITDQEESVTARFTSELAEEDEPTL